MKKIFYLLSLLLAGLIGYSQPVVNRAGPANTVNDPRGMNSLNHYVPRYADTTAANLAANIGIDSAGAIIYTYDSKNFWVRQHSPKKWSIVGQRFGLEDALGTSNRAFNAGGYNFSYTNGNWGFRSTNPTQTLSIGSNAGTETGVLYTPDGTVLKLETTNNASMGIGAGSVIGFQPSLNSGGQIVFDGTLSNFVNQTWYTNGGGLLAKQGIGTYNAISNENEWYLKTFNYFAPSIGDSVRTYLTLYDKMKFINIPNDNATSKIITIDANDNVRYRNASSLSAVAHASNGATLSGDTVQQGGAFTKETIMAQGGYKIQYSGAGDFIVGDSAVNSVAKLQVKNPSARGIHFSTGPEVNSAAYNITSGFDSTQGTGAQSSTNIRTFGLLNSRQIYVQHTPTSYTAKWGIYNQLGIAARGGDSIRLISANSDLLNAGVNEMTFKPISGLSGKKKVQASSFSFDMPSAQLNQIISESSGSGNYYYIDGYIASTVSYMLGSTFDTIANYVGFAASGKGQSNANLKRSFGFVSGRVSAATDTLVAFYALDSFSRSSNAGDQLIGQRLDQPAENQYADSSAQFQVVSRRRGSLPAPAMTTAQMNAIAGTKLNGLLVYNTDSLAYCWWNGTVWTKMGSGSGGAAGVTSVSAGFGHAFTTITGSGSVIADTAVGSSNALVSWPRLNKERDSINAIFTPMARTLTAGYGLTGGGDLSANRTFVFDSATVFTQARAKFWDRAGNTGVSGSQTGDWLGTNNSVPIRFRTANTQRMYLDSARAQLIIGSPTVNANDALIIQAVGAGNYDGFRVFTSNLAGSATYSAAGIQHAGAYDINLTSGGLSLSTVTGVYIGGSFTAPTAWLHIKAGTATAGQAPLKLTAGTNLSTTEAGAIEYNGTHLYFTASNGGTRFQLDQQGAVSSITGTANQVLANGNSGTSEIGAVTLTLPQSIATTSTVQFGGIGIGASAGGPASNSTINPTVTPGAGSTGTVLGIQGTLAEAGSGTHAQLAAVRITAPTITGGAATVTRTASLNITGAPSATVTDRNYAIVVDAGETYFQGAMSYAITSINTTTTLDATHHTVKVDASGGAVTVNLPAAAGCTGRIYIIKKSDSSGNSVTADGNASETIDGSTTKATSTQYGGFSIQSDGTNWVVIATF